MVEPLKLPSAAGGAAAAELPYRLELWDAAGLSVEQLLAVSSTPGIGYAAYYAAIREYLGRRISLSFDGRVLAVSRAR